MVLPSNSKSLILFLWPSPKRIPKSELNSFIKQNRMKVVFFIAPVCRNSKNQDFISKLKTKIPELKDFSRVLNEDQLFIDCNHLNDTGAKRFTEIFAEEVLMRNSKSYMN